MANPEIKKLKKDEIDKLSDILSSSGAYLFDYRGLTVKQMEILRNRIKAHGGNVKVIKNRLAIKHYEALKQPYGRDVFKGPIAVAYADDKFIDVAKTLIEFEKENDKVKIRAGFIEQTFADVAKVKDVAKLPPKEQLLAQLVGSISMPLRKMGMALSAPITNIAMLMNNLKDKKEKEEKV